MSPNPGAWKIVFGKQAAKDARTVQRSNLKRQVEDLLAILAEDPFRSPPPFKTLRSDLAGFYSRRINLQHRLVYQVFESERTVRVLSMWTHYE